MSEQDWKIFASLVPLMTLFRTDLFRPRQSWLMEGYILENIPATVLDGTEEHERYLRCACPDDPRKRAVHIHMSQFLVSGEWKWLHEIMGRSILLL